VVTKLADNRFFYGTGFRIAPGPTITNWHVPGNSADGARIQLQIVCQSGFTEQSLALDTQKFAAVTRISILQLSL
jgi:hypothetical protein